MKPVFCVTLEEARLQAHNALQTLLHEKKQSGTPVLLLLSGGSALSFLENISRGVLGSHMTISVLDERYSKDASANNFGEFTKTRLYTDALAAGALFIDTRVGNDETQEQLKTRFERSIIDWTSKNQTGAIIATMGVGVDGHTAGIMPFPENPLLFQKLFLDEKKWVAAYNAGGKNPYSLRVTVALSFLRTHVNHAVVYAVGQEKSAALGRVLAKEGSIAETPARILHEMKHVQFFTDIHV